ncbi:MAG: glutaredoxin family protein, partial [Fidelibacterota bacterium]
MKDRPPHGGHRFPAGPVLVGALAMLLVSWRAPGATPPGATIYYNEACSDCARYINQRLIPLLEELGVTEVTRKDYVNDRSVRQELVGRNKRLGIPPDLQGHFTVFVGERIILEGHVPEEIIRLLLQSPHHDTRTLVFQDAMGERVTDYRVWSFRGPVREYPITTPVTDYLDWFAANKNDLKPPEQLWSASQFIPLIVSTGLLDGINPCAFAVSLFFIAFLFTIKRTRTDIARVGAVYVTVIYLTYLGIGLG